MRYEPLEARLFSRCGHDRFSKKMARSIARPNSGLYRTPNEDLPLGDLGGEVEAVVQSGADLKSQETLAHSSAPRLSVIIPVWNEEACILPLLHEVQAAIEDIDGGAEMIVVDDGSTDATPKILRRTLETMPRLRVLTITANTGQSAAFEVGFQRARGEILVTLDGDGQNNPADIPMLLDALAGFDAAFGVRAERADGWSRKFAQRIANLVRNSILGSSYRDVGCSLKAFRRHSVERLPWFEGMHRFLPYLVEMRGGRGVEVEVSHRARQHGQSKYRTFGRGWTTFWDLFMVRRMIRKSHTIQVFEERSTVIDATELRRNFPNHNTDKQPPQRLLEIR